jgi:hypothetical protein
MQKNSTRRLLQDSMQFSIYKGGIDKKSQQVTQPAKAQKITKNYQFAFHNLHATNFYYPLPLTRQPHITARIFHRGLSVLPESVTALGATEKLSRRLIASTSLHLPNIDQVVAAFRALHLKRWHRADFLLLLPDNRHLLLDVMLDDPAHLRLNFPACRRFPVTALGTYENHRCSVLFRLTNGTAFRAKLHNKTLCPVFLALMQHPN